MAMLTAIDRQGFVTSNAVFDYDTFLQRQRITLQQNFNKSYIQVYAPAISDEDRSIQVGDPLFRRVVTDATTRSQYPRVFSSFSGYYVVASKVFEQAPLVEGEAPDSLALKGAARRILANEIRFVGLAAKDSGYHPNNTFNSDSPTIQHAGTADVWNRGVTTIEAGDWVAWVLPFENAPRDYNMQGFSKFRMTATFERFDPRKVNPSVKYIAEQIDTKTADQYDDFTKALAKYTELVAGLALAAAGHSGVDLDTRAQATVRTVLGTPTAAAINSGQRSIVPDLLGSLQEFIMREFTRVIGVATTKAEPNQQFSVHMKQLAI